MFPQITRLFIRLAFVILAIAHVAHAASPVTATMDAGVGDVSPKNTWYERGFNTNAPSTGLPAAGVVFEHQSIPGYFYKLHNFTTNNAFLIARNVPASAIRVETSGPLLGLSFLTSAAFGSPDRSVDLTILHEDGTTQKAVLKVSDWFAQTAPALTASGRYDLQSRSFNAVGTANPRLFSREVWLTNTFSPVSEIIVGQEQSQNSFGASVILAVSGSTGRQFRPLTISGFNHDVVIERDYQFVEVPKLLLAAAALKSRAVPAGELVTINFEVRNSARVAAPPSVIRAYFGKPNLAFSESELVTTVTLPPIAALGRYTTNLAFRLPPTTAVGDYRAGLQLIGEPESRPIAQQTFQFFVGPVFFYSILSQGLRTNENGILHEFGLSIRNDGTGSQAATMGIFLGNIADGEDTLVRVGDMTLPPLATGESHEFTISYPVPIGAPGTQHHRTVWIDPDNEIEEAFENRTYSWFYTVPLDVIELLTAPNIADQELVEDGSPVEVRLEMGGTVSNLKSFGLYHVNTGAGIDFEHKLEGREVVITLKPRPERYGVSVVEFRADNGISSVSRTFQVTVHAVNDAPTITHAPDVLIANDQGERLIFLEVGDIDNAPAEMSATITAGDPTLFEPNGVEHRVVNGKQFIALKPRQGSVGSTTVQVIVSDGMATVSDSFEVTLLASTLSAKLSDSQTLKITGGSVEPMMLESSSDFTNWKGHLVVHAGRVFEYNVPATNSFRFFRLQPQL